MSFFQPIRNSTGFTLVEVIIVISIVAMLATYAVPQFFGESRRARFEKLVDEIALTIERARTNALASEVDSFGNVPVGGYGVFFDPDNKKIIAFIDDWQEAGQSSGNFIAVKCPDQNSTTQKYRVNVDYGNTDCLILPDRKFTSNSSGGDTVLKTFDLNGLDYFQLGKLTGKKSVTSSLVPDSLTQVTVIFTPPFAELQIVIPGTNSMDDLFSVEIPLVRPEETTPFQKILQLNRVTGAVQFK